VQHGLVHFSAMADAKANILITVPALIFSVGLTQLRDTSFRPALLVLVSGSALALVLAILCALPGRFRPIGEGRPNLPFFKHFAELPLERYLREMWPSPATSTAFCAGAITP
jgi:hypothetical protein